MESCGEQRERGEENKLKRKRGRRKRNDEREHTRGG